MDTELHPFSQVPRAPVETADTLRSKAKSYMMEAGIDGLKADRIVDCIVGAAMLEMANLTRDMLKEVAASKKEADRG